LEEEGKSQKPALLHHDVLFDGFAGKVCLNNQGPRHLGVKMVGSFFLSMLGFYYPCVFFSAYFDSEKEFMMEELLGELRI
jgi:hypothetical protein